MKAALKGPLTTAWLKVGVVLAILILAWEVLWWILGVEPVMPWRLKSLLGSGTSPFTLVDVRTPVEYRWLHIPGAVNRPDLLKDPAKLEEEDREKPVLVICMTGHRSPVVAYRLKRLGYRNVHNLTWGMLGWILSGGKTT